MEYDSYDAVLHWLFRSTQGDAWFGPSEENIAVGVCLRIKLGHFRVFPYEIPHLAPFEAAVRSLDPLVAVKLRTAAVHSSFALVPEDATGVSLDFNTRIQILDSVTHLPTADKKQCGALIRDERVLIVWSDNLDYIVPQCKEFEEKLVKLAWRSRPTTGISSVTGTHLSFLYPSVSDLNDSTEGCRLLEEAIPAFDAADGASPRPRKRSFWNWKLSKGKSSPPKSGWEEVTSGPQARPIRLLAPVYIGSAAALSLYSVGGGVAVLLSEFRLDQDYLRFASLASAPFLFCVGLFFSLQIILNVLYVIGPVTQFHENSRYYSGTKPEPNPEVDAHLPHVTLEMPVHKESLEETIAPSVFSLRRAMQSYARQGGTSAIFIHDDGLQLISKEERIKRIKFYADHNIGWVARPPHSNEPDGFKRAGQFKKASNLNYGLRLSLMMEKHLQALEAAGEKDGEDGQPLLEDRALELAVDEMFQESGGKWRPWAYNARALRIGEIILLVDSDTVVPDDCLRDAARELTECPEIAIIQHESDVIQVAHHYFENGIAYLTRRINQCASVACANGDVAPFVGHNAFLKWSALQDAAFVDQDGVKKIWSESNVSEDFELALRLQLKGYVIRWATYSECGFKEGVSLTVDDELNRWQKYSYGCNELIFYPLVQWWRRGPISIHLWTFFWSSVPVHYKLSVVSYVFTYYGLAASALLSVLNYLLLGLTVNVDGYFQHNFENWLTCNALFIGASTVCYAILEYRLGRRDFISAFVENLKWVPFLFFFFGGLGIHIITAFLAHMFSYNMTWGGTKKEVESSNFWKEVPKIVKRFWLALLFSALSLAMIVVLSTSLVPPSWRIPAAWGAIYPVVFVAAGHILFPIVLNPWLMRFS